MWLSTKILSQVYLYHLYSESQKLETMPISTNKRIEKCRVVYSVNTVKSNELLTYVTIWCNSKIWFCSKEGNIKEYTL